MKVGELLLWAVRGPLWLLMIPAFRPMLTGGENIASVKDGKTLLISNHISKWDAVLIDRFFAREKIRFMGKHIIFGYWKPYSWLLSKLGVVKVEEPGTGMNWIVKGTELFNSGRTVCMFPEGDRSFGGEMLPFRPGFIMLAKNADACILPMYIDWKYGLFKTMTLAVGERFSLSDYCESAHPDREKIQEMSDICLEKVLALKPVAEKARGKKPSTSEIIS
ncbi:MAG: 1-acyl-sn-glycerol-3-phosphate acyltransferase [Clostridia bacterium]|nr:1-acyl-sn-glycerol-3-phosphate acyltransferase [Clostridia bacterium]